LNDAQRCKHLKDNGCTLVVEGAPVFSALHDWLCCSKGVLHVKKISLAVEFLFESKIIEELA